MRTKRTSACGGTKSHSGTLPPQKLIRLLVSHDLLLFPIPGQRPAQFLRNVAELAQSRRKMALFNVGHWLRARGHTVKEVAHVGAAGGFAVVGFVARIIRAFL